MIIILAYSPLASYSAPSPGVVPSMARMGCKNTFPKTPSKMPRASATCRILLKLCTASSLFPSPIYLEYLTDPPNPRLCMHTLITI